MLNRSELLHLPTRELLSPTRLFFGSNAVPYPFVPDAPKPAQWLSFLTSLFEDDDESIDTLQEWAGYCLTADTSQQKMIMFVGPKRSGKGAIAKVLTAVLGQSNVVAPTFASLNHRFGLQDLLNRSLAMIPDARLSQRNDQAIIVERLLPITGEDLQTADRKNKSSVTTRLLTRFMILTNELPRLTDISGAFASRFVILSLWKSFYGKEDRTLCPVSGLAELLLAFCPCRSQWTAR
ncbi:MAG TPA: hypothetical protein HPP83_06920 [Candidatus Hydrogenedentes bacterium]|nr:hypothetical protein [Candidatus Hydrogenedentota bacterium]